MSAGSGAATKVSGSGWRTAWMTLDLRSLALFRIGLGLAILTDLVDRARSFDVYVRPSPVPASLLQGVRGLSLHALSEAPAFIATLFVIHGLVAVLLVLGVRTRWTTALALVLAASLHARVPPLLYNGDALVRSLLLWALFLPLGARLSVDSRFSREPGTHRSAASVGIVLQAVVLFVASGIAKLWSPAWREGETLTLAFDTLLYPTELGLGFAAAAHDALPLFSYAALAIELVSPLLFFLPWPHARLAGALLYAALLFGIELTLAVGWFPLLGLIVLLALLPTEIWGRGRAWASAAVPPVPPAPTRLPRRANVVAALCATLVVVSSIGTALHLRVQRSLPEVLYIVGVSQNWGMFSEPEKLERGFLHVVGGRADGEVIDLFTHEAPRPGAVPRAFVTELPPFRERRLWESLLAAKDAPLRPFVARWLCAREDVSWVKAFVVQRQDELTPFVLFDETCGDAPRERAPRTF